MLVRGQTLGLRLLHHSRQKLFRHVGLQQAVAVLGEHGRVPYLVIRVQPHKPAEQQVVIHLFHQQSLAADRVQHLQQLRPQQLLRRNRRTAHASVHRIEVPRQLSKYFVHHRSDGAQRMILPHPLLRRQITEDVILLLIVSAHAFSYHTGLWIRSSFSAAC
jgi:hypothetical protein